MAFDTVPSKLHREIFWDVTYDDLKTKVRLYIGEKQALIVQEFQTLHKVASLALGGEDKGSGPKVDANTNLMIPQTGAEAMAAFYKVF